jgi:MFS family permease
MSVPEVLRTAFLPIYLSEAVHLAPALLGYVLAIFSVAGLVAKSVLPRAVARFGRQVMLFAFTTACALALFALPLTISLAAVCVIIACMGLTFGLGRPLSMAMAANAATPGEEGFVVALRLSGNRIADLVLPVVFGSAAGVAGIGAAFVVGAGVLLLGAGALIGPMITEIRAAPDH